MRTVIAAASVLLLAALAPSVACAAPGDAQPAVRSPPGNPVLAGKAVETMSSGGYTYVLVDDGTQKMWAAGFPFNVKTGDLVRVTNGYEMDDFTSPTLGRKFGRIIFASNILVGTNTMNAASALPAGHPVIDGSSAAASSEKPAPGITGTVIETMSVSSYTYVHVRAATQTIWAASDHFQVKQGDTVTVPRGAIMKHFHSPALDRTFDEIYFVDHVNVEGRKP